MTVVVTAGSIVRRWGFVDGDLVERDFPPLTLSFDHAVLGGAPAARFAVSLRRLFETAAALGEEGGVRHEQATDGQRSS